jgi:hypothetical protein
MSRKPRRMRTPNLPPEAFNVPVGATAAQRVSAASSEVAAPRPIDLGHEYKDVLGDLRKTFAIFFGMVVVMLALSFVIR